MVKPPISSVLLCSCPFWRPIRFHTSPVRQPWRIHGFVWKCCVPRKTQWLVIMIIIPIKNGYFIGNIPYFQTNPHGWNPVLTHSYSFKNGGTIERRQRFSNCLWLVTSCPCTHACIGKKLNKTSTLQDRPRRVVELCSRCSRKSLLTLPHSNFWSRTWSLPIYRFQARNLQYNDHVTPKTSRSFL